MAEKKKWISESIKHPGSLKRELHVKKDLKIPASKLKKAEKSTDMKLKKKALLAATLRKLKK